MPAASDRQAVAAIVDDPGAAGDELVARALDRAGFWALLRDACVNRAREPDELRIVLKPDLSGYHHRSPAATDPAVVEALIDQLHGNRYTNVAVVAASDSSSLWAENRDVMALADLLGYRYETPQGRSYEVLDLAEDLVPLEVAQGGLLHDSTISRAWSTADVRVIIPKNRTDESNGYALAIEGLIGVLPLADKDYYYRHRFDAGAVACEVLRAAPPHFTILDAMISSHGSGGVRAPEALATGTVIASADAILADFVGALKMGLDPYVSRVSSAVLTQIGLPRRYHIDGNLAVYPGWRNVHPIVVDATRKRSSWVSASRTLQPWLQQTDSERFPFKEPLNARANAILAPRVSHVDDDATALSLLAFVNYLTAWIHRQLEAYRSLYDKDALRLQHVPLGLDLDAFSTADYESATTELAPLRDLLHDTPPDPSGLKWRYVGEAVLFEIARTIPCPFEEFVIGVDVARTIQFMNDYIGGVVVPVRRDESGRVTHQAERNLYLPQPNYLVLYDGKLIDVSKLEYVEYTDDMHRMWWKTIRSENESARYDDGVVTFERHRDGTHVSIFGRQLFALPLFWQAVNLDLNPGLKSELVTHAYTTFFHRTFSNFEALLEGRRIKIGSPWHEPSHAADSEPLPIETIGRQAVDLAQKYWPLVERILKPGSASQPSFVDEHGFAHFRASSAGTGPIPSPVGTSWVDAATARKWADFWSELSEAVRRDVDSSAWRQGGVS